MKYVGRDCFPHILYENTFPNITPSANVTTQTITFHAQLFFKNSNIPVGVTPYMSFHFRFCHKYFIRVLEYRQAKQLLQDFWLQY